MTTQTVSIDKCQGRVAWPNLMATEAMVRRHHPDFRGVRPGCAPGICSADFRVDLSQCRTALGRYLADKIATTRREDDASRVRVQLPENAAGHYLCAIGERMSRSRNLTAAGLARGIEEARAQLAELEAVHAMHGEGLFWPRVVDYEWPVFGSIAGGRASGVDTAEAYFDLCARAIRSLGGKILSVGIFRECPSAEDISAYGRRRQ